MKHKIKACIFPLPFHLCPEPAHRTKKKRERRERGRGRKSEKEKGQPRKVIYFHHPHLTFSKEVIFSMDYNVTIVVVAVAVVVVAGLKWKKWVGDENQFHCKSHEFCM